MDIIQYQKIAINLLSTTIITSLELSLEFCNEDQLKIMLKIKELFKLINIEINKEKPRMIYINSILSVIRKESAILQALLNTN